jgi:hypothetical protein
VSTLFEKTQVVSKRVLTIFDGTCEGLQEMTRGKKPTTAIDEAKSCAEKMGYRWCRNTDPEFPFDAFIFRDAVIAVVKVKKVRYSIDDKKPAEKIFPDEIKALRALPMPLFVLRELWVRTQNERAWRRFYILSDVVGELGFNKVEGYVNPHYDEEKWKTDRQIIINPLEVLKRQNQGMPAGSDRSNLPPGDGEGGSDGT